MKNKEIPNRTDIIAVKKIQKYLAGKKDQVLRKKDLIKIILNAYCDADYVKDANEIMYALTSRLSGNKNIANEPSSWVPTT